LEGIAALVPLAFDSRRSWRCGCFFFFFFYTGTSRFQNAFFTASCRWAKRLSWAVWGTLQPALAAASWGIWAHVGARLAAGADTTQDAASRRGNG